MLSILLKTNWLDLNESSGVYRAKTLKRVYRSILCRVKVTYIALLVLHIHVALIRHYTNLASYVFLAEDNGVLNLYKTLEATNPLELLESVKRTYKLPLRAKVLK